jgi:hypothetical protein
VSTWWKTPVVGERSSHRLDVPKFLVDVGWGVVYVSGRRLKRIHNEAVERVAA